MDLTRFADDYWAAKDDRVDQARLELYLKRLPKEGEILVVDAGPGMLPERIRALGRSVQMTDLSSLAVARAKAKGLRACQVDTDDHALPFADDQFDCVISDSAIEHRYHCDRALDECVRVLKPGGRFLLLVPNIAHWRYRLWLLFGHFPEVIGGPSDRCHLRMFALPELKRLLRDRGLRIQEVTGWPSLWVKGLYPKIFRFPPIASLYHVLTRLWPSLCARDLLLLAELPLPSLSDEGESPV